MEPPKLNTEFRSSLPKAVAIRDTKIFARQEKITACIAANSKVISHLLSEDSVKNLLILESLCDVNRIMCDIQHDETAVRRGLILSNYQSPLKEALSNIPADEFLFGKDLVTILKNAKSLERTTKHLKPNKNSKPQKN